MHVCRSNPWDCPCAGSLVSIDSSEDPHPRLKVGVNKLDRYFLAYFCHGIGTVRSDRILRELAVRGPYKDSIDVQLRVFGIGPRLAAGLWSVVGSCKASARYIVIYERR